MNTALRLRAGTAIVRHVRSACTRFVAVVTGLAAWMLCASCREAPTQTWVFVHLDPGFESEATALRVRIDASGEQVEDRTDPIDRSRAIVANLFLVPDGGDATRTWEIHAELLRGAEVVAHLRVGGGYTAGEVRVVHAHFQTDADCLAKNDCGLGRTCQSGRCVGACFEAVPDGGEDLRQQALCGECAQCAANECQPVANGSDCGCAADQCRDGQCVPDVEVREIAVARGHACAVTSKGLWCWGHARTRQTSFSEDSDRPRPLTAPEVQSARDLALGTDFSCVLWIRSGAMHGRTCWGWSDAGSFAMGDLGGVRAFEEVDETSGDNIVDIDAGSLFSCALWESGKVQCAGSNDSNQLALPDAVERSSEWVEIEGNYDSLEAGDSGACAHNDTGVYCWGLSTFDSTVRSPEVRCVPGSDAPCAPLDSAVLGNGFACGLRSDGAALCWGENTGGRLGVDGPERLLTATPIDSELRFRSLTAAPRGVCGITREGGLYCWGDNTNAALGVGDQLDRSQPTRVEVDAADRWTRVAIDRAYGCAIREGGELYCWGANAGTGHGSSRLAGRLGLGLGTDPDDPAAAVVVTRPSRVCFDDP